MAQILLLGHSSLPPARSGMAQIHPPPFCHGRAPTSRMLTSLASSSKFPYAPRRAEEVPFPSVLPQSTTGLQSPVGAPENKAIPAPCTATGRDKEKMLYKVETVHLLFPARKGRTLQRDGKNKEQNPFFT